MKTKYQKQNTIPKKKKIQKKKLDIKIKRCGKQKEFP